MKSLKRLFVPFIALSAMAALATSAPVSAQEAPIAPASCSMVRTGSTIDLNWTPAANDNAERYVLRRSRNSGTTYWAGIALPPATTFTQSGLSTSSTYEYWVETKSPAGTFSNRTECESNTPPPAAPVAPTACTAVRTGNTIQLDWTRAANDNAERFVLRRSRNGGTTYWAGIALPPATTFTQSGLSTSSTYEYWVETKSPQEAFSSRTECLTGGQPVNPVQKVIHISIDGLRPDHVTQALTPNLVSMIGQGASTMNARSDYSLTVTLPNHTGQLTGRRALGPDGFNIAFNTDNGSTVHSNAGFYVESSFSVAHDNGLETFALVGKDKFDLLDRSWDATNGAADTTGADNGTDKIDSYVYLSAIEGQRMVITNELANGSADYLFWHIPTPDAFGHPHGWGSNPYQDAVTRADTAIGELLATIAADPALASSTAIIVTADHGGTSIGPEAHADHTLGLNYTIPFIVNGPGVAVGDLYALNAGVRLDPGVGRPDEDGIQPIRGSEAGNLALQLLGLNPIPGSRYNALHDLNLS